MLWLLALLVHVLLFGGTAIAQDDESLHRAEAIRRYEALLNNPSPALSGRKDEVMFRLGLLHFEQAQSIGPGQGPYAAEGAYRQALSLLDQVLARRDTIFREEALYYRAIILQETGRAAESIDVFRQLLREFPASERAAEVWFRIGNDAIQKSRLREAYDAYEEVLRRGHPNYRDQAAYMFSWTALSLRQESRARTTLMDLLLRLEAGGQQQANLYPEAIELLAKVLRGEGDTSSLSGPWVGARPAFASAVLKRVAELFRETSAFHQAAVTYEQYLREYPETTEVDAIEKIIIESYLKAGEPEPAQAARLRLISRHAPSGTLEAASVAEISPVVKDAAVYFHEQGRKNKQPELFRQAVGLYQLYAASVGGPSQWEAVFLQAEAMKEMGDLRGAAERYRLVAESKDAGRGEESAFRRVALFEDLRAAGQASVPEVVAAYEDHFRLYPGAKREIELRSRYTGYLFDQKQFGDALVAGAAVVNALADVTERRKMKLLLARSAFSAGDFFQCSNWAAQLLNEPGLPADVRRETEEIHVAALYKGAEALPDRPVDAAAQYELLASLYPKHKTAPAALYNAAVLLRDAGETARALGLFRRMIDNYPNSDLHRDATVAATAILKESGDSAGASSLLERAASGTQSAGESAQYLFEAAQQAEAVQAHNRSIDLYRKFLKVHAPNDVRAARARLAIAKAAGQLGQADEAERVARQTLTTLPSGVGDEAQTLQLIAAEARLILGDAALRRFERVRLVEPLAVNLKKKQQAMEDAVAELRRAAAFGFADVSLASYYKIGYAQLDFSNAIMQAPRPKNLSFEQLAQYEDLLRQQTAPYREAAEKAFRVALEQGSAAGVENEWTSRSRAALDQFGSAPPAPAVPDVPILPGS